MTRTSLLAIVFLFVGSTNIYAEDKLIIGSATYGDFKNSKNVDVTEKVAAKVKNGTLHLEVSNELFTDPASNVGKLLKVKFEWNGKEQELEIPEGETLLLPQPELKGELAILSATYGDLPDGDTYDVLKLVKRAVKKNQLLMTVDNDMFGDPAPGAFKRLRVEYQFGDVKLAKTVYENGTIKIALPEAGEQTEPGDTRGSGTATGIIATAEAATVIEKK